VSRETGILNPNHLFLQLIYLSKGCILVVWCIYAGYH